MVRLLAALNVALIFFAAFVLLAVAGGVQWLSEILRIIPAPTEHWAEIIGHLAWPLTIAWLVVRYRHSLRRLAEIIITRAKTDNLNFGNIFQVTQNSRFIPLARKGTHKKDDAFYREQLLEYVRAPDNIGVLENWLENQGRKSLKIVELVTHMEYEDLRERAYRELIEGGGDG